jgi:Starter unit:ACP transacylase in aflatoxin biosynthesis
MVGAALAVSPELSGLPSAGAEVIRIAARLEILTREVAEDLEAVEPGEAPASWAILINGLDSETVKKEVDIFNTEKVRT